VYEIRFPSGEIAGYWRASGCCDYPLVQSVERGDNSVDAVSLTRVG
jgi:hypothetical protein